MMPTVINKKISLQSLTGRKSGVLLFRFQTSTDVIIGDWSGCREGELPIQFMGRSVIPMPRQFACKGERRSESVLSEIPENVDHFLDRNDRLSDLEDDDPEGTVFDLVTGDGNTVTVLVPDGWQ